MKKLKIPVTPHITKHLKHSKVKHSEVVAVDYQSYAHFKERIDREYAHRSEAERDALIVSCCLTHPDHREKHKPKKHYGVLSLAVLALLALLLALFSLKAHAQESGLDRITFQNSSGTTLRSFVSPFVFKCSTNMTCSITGNTVTVSAAGGGAGGGYSVIQNGGAAIAAETAINFLGSFSCVDNPGNTSSDCKLTASAPVAHQFVTGVDSSGNYLRATILAADVPTLNQNTTGNAATATAFAANPTDCSTNQYANAIDASGNLTCSQVGYGQITSTPQLAVTKTCTGTDKVSAYDSTTGLFTCTIDQTGAGGGGSTEVQVNGVDTTAQTPINFQNGTNITVSNPSAGNVEADLSGTIPCANQPALTGDITSSAGSCATNITSGAVQRSDLAADAVGWQFLGTQTLGGTSSTITVLLSTPRKHLIIRGFIKSYAAAGIARFQMGNVSTVDTGTNYGFAMSNIASATTTLAATSSSTTAMSGVPVSASTTTASRFLRIAVDNLGANIKYVEIFQVGAATSATTSPNVSIVGGVWNNTTNGIGIVQLQACTTQTGSCTTTTFGATSYLSVWGRDDN